MMPMQRLIQMDEDVWIPIGATDSGWKNVEEEQGAPVCAFCGRDRGRDHDVSCPGCGGTEMRGRPIEPKGVKKSKENYEREYYEKSWWLSRTGSTGPR